MIGPRRDIAPATANETLTQVGAVSLVLKFPYFCNIHYYIKIVYIFHIIKRLERNKTDLTLQWILSHINIIGNKKADEIPKDATTLSSMKENVTSLLAIT